MHVFIFLSKLFLLLRLKLLRLLIGFKWVISGALTRHAGQKSTSTEPGPLCFPHFSSYFLFHCETTAGLLAEYCVSLFGAKGTRHHDMWAIERWDSLHCIWRWLAAGLPKSTQVSCGGRHRTGSLFFCCDDYSDAWRAVLLLSIIACRLAVC
ncbi:hypothetical protein BJX70DRAFT_301024 [Aspergillus crustosus]